MNAFPKLILVILLSFMGASLLAQNEIHKKNGEILFVKVVEIGLDEIKYESPTDPGVIISIDKAAVAKLVMANNREEDVKIGFDNEAFYAEQKKKIIKVNFMAPLTSYFFEGLFEKSIAPGKSFELGLGIIGIGTPRNNRYYIRHEYNFTGIQRETYLEGNTSRGVFIRGGYKFLNTPDYIMRGMRYSHILKGVYAKPSMIFGTYFISEVTEENSEIVRRKNRNVSYGAFTIELGKQWIFQDAISLNIYAGIGYGSASQRDFFSSQFGVLINSNNDVGLAFNSGLNIGYLIK